MDPKQAESGEYAQELDFYTPHHSGINDTDLKKVRIRYFGNLHGIKVYMIDGEFIRNGIYVDFTNGGNPGRYVFIPEGEIWIDNEKPNDFTATLIHEFVECHHMIKNKKSYDDAHEIANKFERAFRQKVKDGTVKLTSHAQIVPFLNRFLKFKAKKGGFQPHKENPNAPIGDFGKFSPDRNAQF